jgi:hypothetical protein
MARRVQFDISNAKAAPCWCPTRDDDTQEFKMKNIEMTNVSDTELAQVDGSGWLAIAGGVALGGLLIATGVAEVAALAAVTVYAVECELMGANK